MTKRQIIHALQIVDDMHRISAETRPGAVVPIRANVADLVKIMRRRADTPIRAER